MIKLTERILVIAIIGIMLIGGGVVASAHSPNHDTLVSGGERVGWSLGSSHIGDFSGAYFYDSFNTSLTSSLKSITNSGASMWSSYKSFYQVGEHQGLGEIITENKVNNVIATFYCFNVDSSNNHFNGKWFIRINLHKIGVYTSTVAAHEFGHAIGLDDLTSSSNNNKLMYYSNATSASGPTTADKMGAQIMMGTHTHYWTIKRSINPTQHVTSCNVCKGDKLALEISTCTSFTWKYYDYSGGSKRHAIQCTCGNLAMDYPGQTIQNCNYGANGTDYFCTVCGEGRS